ncbi:MAG: hypothetical protein ACLFP8_06220 [Alphaproteobacteria bacterium]
MTLFDQAQKKHPQKMTFEQWWKIQKQLGKEYSLSVPEPTDPNAYKDLMDILVCMGVLLPDDPDKLQPDERRSFCHE